MPLFELTRKIIFPAPELAHESGILAVGGDLRPKRLIKAYRQGIFPWYGENEPIIWWSPDPRFVLFPEALKISDSMKRIMKSKQFSITYDKNFPEVIAACKKVPRKGQSGQTWITDEMVAAYCRLNEMGIAHSVEVWHRGRLAGGLYGLLIGSLFFGESMFYKKSNASKAGFIDLVLRLKKGGISLIDCQVHTPHLESLGGRFISRKEYLKRLKSGLKKTLNLEL
jgi:leucyl/phenylalanyl-tRNA--protein transferase